MPVMYFILSVQDQTTTSRTDRGSACVDKDNHALDTCSTTLGLFEPTILLVFATLHIDPRNGEPSPGAFTAEDTSPRKKDYARTSAQVCRYQVLFLVDVRDVATVRLLTDHLPTRIRQVLGERRQAGCGRLRYGGTSSAAFLVARGPKRITRSAWIREDSIAVRQPISNHVPIGG